MLRYRFSDFTLSTRTRLLIRNGQQLPLIPRYLDLLIFLVERRRDAVHRREIFDRVWSDVIVSDSALSQAIRTLRRTLDGAGSEASPPPSAGPPGRGGGRAVSLIVDRVTASRLGIAPATIDDTRSK